MNAIVRYLACFVMAAIGAGLGCLGFRLVFGYDMLPETVMLFAFVLMNDALNSVPK